MNKKQVLKIISTIETYYNQPWTRKFKPQDQNTQLLLGNPQTKEDILLDVVNAWHMILEKYEYEKVFANLMQHIETSKFPPTIADLTNAEKVVKSRAIPDPDETKAMMLGWQRPEEEKADPDEVETQLAAMRDMLGIKRG